MADKARIAFAALPALAACIALAQTNPVIEVTARVDGASVTVGDPIRYLVEAIAPPGVQVDLPSVKGNTGALEVLGYAVSTDTVADGRVRTTHALTLAAYEVGEDTLPPQRAEIRVPEDTAALVLYTQPTYISVRPVAAGARDIADIHDGDRLPGAVPWALPLLGLAALALWAWLRRRARRPKVVPAAPAPVITPEEAAFARLRALTDPAFAEDRAFAFALSEILREYLAARFGIDALEATTAELLERAAPLPLPASEHAWLEEVAVALDAVKFATAPLTPEARNRLLREAESFVHAAAAAQAEAEARKRLAAVQAPDAAAPKEAP